MMFESSIAAQHAPPPPSIMRRHVRAMPISHDVTERAATAPADPPNPTIANRRLPASAWYRVVGKRPELRDHHQIEDAHPQEKHDAHDRGYAALLATKEEADQR